MLKTLKATLIAGAAALTAASMATPAQAADRFRVEITNMRSGLKADVIWASQAEHQGVFLWPNNNSASQEFDLLDSGGGYFRIRARHSSQCLMLDWSTGSYTNGTPVIQHPYCAAGYAPAEWRVAWASAPRQCGGGVCSTSSASYPVLINRKTGKCLDARNDSGGTPRVQAICSSGPASAPRRTGTRATSSGASAGPPSSLDPPSAQDEPGWVSRRP